MIDRSELAEQFKALGSVPSNDVLDKCVEICIGHSLEDAEEFVEQWMAFSVSNLGGADPTVEHLKQMERKEFGKRDTIISTVRKTVDRASTSRNLKIYNASACDDMDTDDDVLLDTYGCTTPNRKNVPYNQKTPENVTLKKQIAVSAFSPASFSPTISTPTEKSENSGTVVCTFGKSNVANPSTWKGLATSKVNVVRHANSDGEYLTSNSHYMYDNLTDKCLAIGENMYRIGKELCDRYLNTSDASKLDNASDASLNETDLLSQEFDVTDYHKLSNVNVGGQDVKTCIGRVYCDADGRLNPESVMLHGTDDQALRTTKLHFNNLKSYELFPGQVCMIKGVNPRGNIMYPQEVLYDVAVSPSQNLIELSAFDCPLQIVVATGPFTTSDNLNYQPLKDITQYIKTNTPQIVILVGPFIESDHISIQEGELAETFQDFFEKMVSGIMESVQNTETQVLIVASSRDAVAASVYPTPPYTLRRAVPYTNLHLLPDPCTVSVQGVVFTITATDVMKHLGEEELSHNAGRDKIKRIVRYVLRQKNIYPLHPPSHEICLDSSLWNRFCRLDTSPHVLVVPSDQKYYARDVDGVLALNTGRVADGLKCGTFGRLEIHPMSKGTSLYENLVCQVIRV